MKLQRDSEEQSGELSGGKQAVGRRCTAGGRCQVTSAGSVFVSGRAGDRE